MGTYFRDFRLLLHDRKILLFLTLIGSFAVSAWLVGFLVLGSDLTVSVGAYRAEDFFNTGLSPGYMPFSIITALLIWQIPIYIMRRRFALKNDDLDPAVFAKSGEHGTARAMTHAEAQKLFPVTSIDDTKFNLIGWENYKARTVYNHDPEISGFNMHQTICGTSGSGKTTSAVFPLILQMVQRGESIVVTDTSGEAFEKMSEICRHYGYVVRVINLIDPVHSDGINIFSLFDYTDDMVATAESLSNLIAANCATDENYFSQATSSFISFLLVYIAMNGPSDLLKSGSLSEDAGAGGVIRNKQMMPCSEDIAEKNLLSLYDMALADIETLTAILDGIDKDSPIYTAASQWAKADAKHQMQAKMTVEAWMSALSVPAYKEMLSHNDTSLLLPGIRKCAYFISVPSTNKSVYWLAALIYGCMIDVLVNKVAYEQPDKALPVTVNLLLDEFPNIFHIPGWTNILNNVRKNHINAIMMFQSMQDMERAYPDSYNAIFNAAHISSFFGANDVDTAKFYAEKTGDATVYTERENTLASGLVKMPNRAQSTTSRLALTPDMVLRINEHNEHNALIFPFSHHYMKVKSVFWKELPAAQYYRPVQSMNHIPVYYQKIRKKRQSREESIGYFDEVMADLKFKKRRHNPKYDLESYRKNDSSKVFMVFYRAENMMKDEKTIRYYENEESKYESVNAGILQRIEDEQRQLVENSTPERRRESTRRQDMAAARPAGRSGTAGTRPAARPAGQGNRDPNGKGQRRPAGYGGAYGRGSGPGRPQRQPGQARQRPVKPRSPLETEADSHLSMGSAYGSTDRQSTDNDEKMTKATRGCDF